MTEFVSEVKHIPYSDDKVYAMLSDFNNLERIKDRIPQDKVKDFHFDGETVSFAIDPVGSIAFKMVEREPCKLVKLKTTNSPIPLFLWVQLKPANETSSYVKITAKAEINAFLKPMVSKPMQEAVDRIAQMIASLSY